jgi:hypothetical protein
MTIPTIEYRGYELRAYSHPEFPLHRDPYAKGPRRFSSVVTVDPIPSAGAKLRRYSTLFGGTGPTTASDAVELAMQFGKDIVDGKAQAAELRHTECRSVRNSSGAGMQYPLFVCREVEFGFRGCFPDFRRAEARGDSFAELQRNR